MPAMVLTDLPAPAKLNLFLHVVGRRPDGYHLLQSLFVLVDWADRITLSCRDDGALHRHDTGATLPDDDLCLRAARALQQASGCRQGVDIHITKRLPWGAGLGGGSSDAATVLIGLNRLWGLHWTRERLQELGLRLGADVPFFIGGRSALVEGIGEILTPVDLPPEWFAIVKPPGSIGTAQLFSSKLLTRDSRPATVAGLLAELHALVKRDMSPASYGRNDLQPAAEAEYPDVREALGWLKRRYGASRMTGSGSAVFASVGAGDPPLATWPEGELPEGWVGHLCRSLTRHPLADWLD